MSLSLWYKTPPNVEILERPPVGPAEKDVVGHDIVVAECGHDWDNEVVVRRMMMIRLPKNLGELGDHELVLLYNLLLGTWYILIVVVASRVACPYYKVDVVLDVVVDPLKGLVGERVGRVAAGRLCTVDSSRAMLTVAGSARCSARVCFVEGVWVEVCSIVIGCCSGARADQGCNRSNLPVTCKNLPVNRRPAALPPLLVA